MNTAIEIVPYTPVYAAQTVAMWRASKEAAIGQKEIHSVADHQGFLNEVLANQFEVFIALRQQQVVAMIAYSKTEVSQLYVHVDSQGQGLGKLLLQQAKSFSSGSLSLYTFEVNRPAQQFYLSQGFVEISRGCDNEEQLPDILYRWQA